MAERNQQRDKGPEEQQGEREATSSRLAEVAGVLVVSGAIYLAVSIFSRSKWDNSLLTFSKLPVKNYGGVVGSFLSDLIISIAGIAGYLLPLFLIAYGIRKILHRPKSTLQLFGTVLFFPSLAMLVTLFAATLSAGTDNPGGLIGLLLARTGVKFLSGMGAYLLGITCFIASIVLLSPVSLSSLLNKVRVNYEQDEPELDERKKPQEPVEAQPVFEELSTPSDEGTPEYEDPTPIPKYELPVSAVRREKPPAEEEDNDRRFMEDGGYRIPPLELLTAPDEDARPVREDLQSVLERKLLDFGISGKVKQSHLGPVVTMYEFEPAPGVKINKIVNLADDLALAMRAPSIRVYPIEGKAAIGIEVPNRRRASVSFREIIGSSVFQNSPSLLTIALGKDIFGNPVTADLAEMRHLLVAGATGSGKSVSVNAMIMSLLYKASPAQVNMLMIDPKLLELSTYADIPHLISPVITDPKEASDALKKVVFEMERRYKLLAERGSRNIEGYNREVGVSERLPYIVVFIDELADLMMTAPSDVETAIARLAQKARASGIHLILATQRPSVDVITGLIKANFPARISFQVTSKIDSRTILDAPGAEQLLGMGDMLYMRPGVKMTRIHGAYVSDGEVREVVSYVKSQGKPDFSSFESISVPDEKEGTKSEEERDEMYFRALEFAEAAGEVSISSIQRRFKIGYNKAAGIMEQFEQDGLVGPPRGAGKPRDFLGRRD